MVGSLNLKKQKIFRFQNGYKIRLFDVSKNKEKACNEQELIELWLQNNENYNIQLYDDSKKCYKNMSESDVNYKLFPLLSVNYKRNKFFNVYQMLWNEVFVVYNYGAGVNGDEEVVTHIKFANKEEYNKIFAL